MILLPAELFGDLIEAREERIDEIVELLVGRSQGKRAAMEKLHFEKFFELKNLSADSWLP